MILICEPHCEGYQHVEFNTAFLAAVRHAFPEPVLFMAEPGHLGLVTARAARVGLEGIAYRPIQAQPVAPDGPLRVFREGRLVREVLQLAALREARAVIFTSVGAGSLFALKLLASGSRIPCAVVPHGVLGELGDDGGAGWFPRVLRMPNPAQLRYLFLSRPIEQQVLDLVPGLVGATSAIEHPYLFAAPLPHRPTPPPLRFATLGSGVGSDALAALIDLARDAQQHRGGKGSFVHIGPVQDLALAESARDVVHFPSRRFLPREQYERELAGVDYVLFLSQSPRQRFSASGALLDALSLGRPVVALRTPYFEHCFETLGDIGYLCDSLEQARTTLRTLLSRFPKAHYAAQQQEMETGREVFSPRAVGESLRAAVAGWEGRSAA